MTDIQQVISHLGELKNILNLEDGDIKDQGKHAQCLRKMQDLRLSLDEQYKQDIQALLDMNQDIEVDSASNVSDEDQELQDLTAQLKQAKDHQQMLQQNLQTVEESITATAQEQEAVKQEYHNIKDKTTASLPKIRHEVNLLSNISKIRWQYDCGAEEIKGYMCNSKEVKPFAMNSEQNSEFFIANYLWDLMDEEW